MVSTWLNAVLRVWRSILKIGCTADMTGLQRSRVMMLNGVMLFTSLSVVGFFISYIAVGYRYYYSCLYIIPVAAVVLILNHQGKYAASRNVYFWGSLAVIAYWCYEGRGNGNEFTLIGLATTSTLVFQKRFTLYACNVLCAVVFVLYKIWDNSIPFVPDPSLNYHVLPVVLLLVTIGVVSFQIAFFRDLVHHYDSKLLEKYTEINQVLDQETRVQEELKSTNEALKESNSKLQNISYQLELSVKRNTTKLQSYIEAINLSLYSCIQDAQGLFTMVNEPLVEVSGYTREELVGQHYRIFDTGQISLEKYEERKLMLFSGKNWVGEVRNKKKDGSYFWFDCIVIPIRDEHDNIYCFLSLGLPITERKLNEEIRQKAQSLLETIAFTTSHEIRGPLATIEGIANLINGDHVSESEFKMLAAQITKSVEDMKLATGDLVTFVNNHPLSK